MTVEQYIESSGMTQKAFCQLTGIPASSLSNYLYNGKGIHKKYFERLQELNIECEGKSEKQLTGFDHFRNAVHYAINGAKTETLYCWNTEQIKYLTNLLNEKKIAYYSYFKDCYWVVKYDKREEWIASVDLVN